MVSLSAKFVLVLVVLETTAKRLKIIAQGFSPGLAIIWRCALKVAPEGSFALYVPHSYR
jgi:hypothetical protein